MICVLCYTKLLDVFVVVARIARITIIFLWRIFLVHINGTCMYLRILIHVYLYMGMGTNVDILTCQSW